MVVNKEFEDGEYYQGTIIAGPEYVEKEDGIVTKSWRVRYEDGDEEDLDGDELQLLTN